MKRRTRRARSGAALAALAIAIGLAGCTPGKGSTPATTTPHVDAKANGAGEHGATGQGEAVVPAGSAAGIWSQIQARQLALETTINEGRLSEVHREAFAIRDLAVALRAQAGTAPGADLAALDARIADVKTIAGKLDEYGDAGNLSGTEAEFAKLNSALAAIGAAVPH